MAECFKRGYADVLEARDAAWRMERANRLRGVHLAVRPYLCPKCRQWHIGRGAKGLNRPSVEIDASGRVTLVIRSAVSEGRSHG